MSTSNVVMYTTKTCSYCRQAKALLNKHGYHEIEMIYVDEDPIKRQEMMTRTDGKRTVPQIFIDEKYIGGFDDLSAWFKSQGKN